jgi:hypothetical protein
MPRVGSEAGRYGGFQSHGHSGIADIIQPLSITTAAITDAYGSVTFTFPSIPVSQDWVFSCNVADAPSTAVFLAESVPTNLGSWTAGNNAGPFKCGANETLVVLGFALLPNVTYQCTITGEAVTSGKSSNVFPYPSTSTVIAQNQAGLSTLSLQILQKSNAGNIGYSATATPSTSIAVTSLDSAIAGTSIPGFTITVYNVFALGSRGLYLCWNQSNQYQIYNPTTGSISVVYNLPLGSGNGLTISPDGFYAINWQSTTFYLVELTTFTYAPITVNTVGSGGVTAFFDSTSKYTICVCVSSPNYWINVTTVADITTSTRVFGNSFSASSYQYTWLATPNAVYVIGKSTPSNFTNYFEKFTWTNINVSWTNTTSGSFTNTLSTAFPSVNYNTFIYNATLNKTYLMMANGLYYFNGTPDGTPTLVPTTTAAAATSSINFDKTNTYVYSQGATNVLWRTTVATQTAVSVGTYTWPNVEWAYNFIQQQPFATLPTGYAYRIATVTVYNSTATTGNVALSTNSAFTSGIFAVVPVNTTLVLNGRMIPSSIYALNNVATGTTYLEIGYDLVFYNLTSV